VWGRYKQMKISKGRRVTIKDIAKNTGYSIATVSRVLNDSGMFYSKQTYDKIKKAIEELDYHPDGIARGLKTRKTFNIAFLEPWTSEFFTEIFLGIQDAANENGYSVATFISNYKMEQEERNIRTILSNRLDGVIVPCSVLNKGNIKKLKEQNIPVVTIEKFLEDKEVPAVSIKNLEVSKKAIGYLIGLGHRAIGFMGEPLEVGKVNARFMGYKNALEEAKINFNSEFVFVDEKLREEKYSDSYEFVKKNIDRILKCSALFITSDKIAITVIRVLKETGVLVPEDISVIGFDGLEISKYITPALTTILQPKYEMGRVAMEILLKMINNKPRENIELKAELLISESTSPPRETKV
jgi:LacI family transcriptional regulator